MTVYSKTVRYAQNDTRLSQTNIIIEYYSISGNKGFFLSFCDSLQSLSKKGGDIL